MPISPKVAPLVLGAHLAACSMGLHPPLPVERPTATVRSATLGTALSAGLFAGIDGSLALDITNPNAFGIPLAGIDWELRVGSARAATGAIELSQTIPARATAPVTASFALAARDAAAAAAAIADGARDYQLALRLHFATSLGRIEVDAEHRGELRSTLLGVD